MDSLPLSSRSNFLRRPRALALSGKDPLGAASADKSIVARRYWNWNCIVVVVERVGDEEEMVNVNEAIDRLFGQRIL